MPDLLTLLDDAARGRSTLRFPEIEQDSRPFERVWSQSTVAGRWLREQTDGSVAFVLSASPECLAALMGAWRVGLTGASLPHPARGMSIEEYQEQTITMCRLVEAEVLVIDDEYLPLIPDLPVRVVGYSECFGPAPARSTDDVGDLVQFTSGSTSRPKGIRLPMDAVGANVHSIITGLGLQPGEVSCSWLPLSHDMGLIGMCLAAICAGSDAYTGRMDVILLPPESFLRRPSIWLETCARFGATATTVPNFAFDLAARFVDRSPPGDLSSLRICLTGGERVRAESLRVFTEATSPFGFSSRALSPAYGLAEATLAVSAVPPGEHWTAARIDPLAVADGRWIETDEGAEDVSAGVPLPDMEIRIAAEPGSEVGEIQVRGPSLLQEYVGADMRLDDGWLPTGDTGAIANDGLHVLGRLDDLIIVRGRNLYAWEMEKVAGTNPVVRPGNCTIVSDDAGAYAVVAEPVKGTESGALDDACDAIRRSLSSRFGAAPSTVVFVSPGALPKTPSGKIQRHKVGARLRADELPVEARRSYAGVS